jgi:hypothetical protein
VNFKATEAIKLDIFQLVLAVESWRTQHQEQLKEWIDCWAEFEALNAIACYAHEQSYEL